MLSPGRKYNEDDFKGCLENWKKLWRKCKGQFWFLEFDFFYMNSISVTYSLQNNFSKQ